MDLTASPRSRSSSKPRDYPVAQKQRPASKPARRRTPQAAKRKAPGAPPASGPPAPDEAAAPAGGAGAVRTVPGAAMGWFGKKKNGAATSGGPPEVRAMPAVPPLRII